MIVCHANHLARQGHQVTIMAAVVESVFPLDPHVSLVRIGNGMKYGTVLNAVSSRFDHDLVIADIIAMAFLLSMRNAPRVVYFAQDYDESYYANPMARWFIRFLYRYAFSVQRIRTIAVSNYLVTLFRQRFGHTAHLCENGIDTSVFHPGHDLAGKEPRAPFRILLLARSDYRKGFDCALRVVENLWKRGRHFEIWTVGEKGWEREIPFPCREFGYVGDSALASIFRSVDMFLYPSRHEGFPLMPLEAMSCGCPVVTTTAVPYARDGENALVAPIEDVSILVEKVLQLVESASLRSVIREKGMEFSRHHTLEDSCQTFERILLTMCAPHA